MKKIIISVVVTGVLCVLFTVLYFKTTNEISPRTFTGTYMISHNMNEYLAIIPTSDEYKGEFVLYDVNVDSKTEQKGKYQINEDYVSLETDTDTYIVFYVNKNYYLISKDMQPQILEKISNSAIDTPKVVK